MLGLTQLSRCVYCHDEKDCMYMGMLGGWRGFGAGISMQDSYFYCFNSLGMSAAPHKSGSAQQHCCCCLQGQEPDIIEALKQYVHDEYEDKLQRDVDTSDWEVM